MITYTVKIRELGTRKEVDWHSNWESWEHDPTGKHGLRFMFEDGNYCCDCNRKIFFGQAQGIEFSDEETPCGKTEYWVRVTIDATGVVVLDELKQHEDYI